MLPTLHIVTMCDVIDEATRVVCDVHGGGRRVLDSCVC